MNPDSRLVIFRQTDNAAARMALSGVEPHVRHSMRDATHNALAFSGPDDALLQRFDC
ncbi:hypothetical protein [Caballeronia sp. GAWG1-5s-s]|uniref:hypothetical protein n=1 Tax=Caballeronia sp. GAWG1-5s-s TaxID=2921743 RepID=UPI0020298FDC|nr:hypothetical protein [Caballeronia sp. GAWG1-5s-s]